MSDSSRPLVITKMQGAGNSFLLTAEPVPLELRAKITKKLCEVNFGIGADGMVFLGTPSSEVAEWDFYNSDGSVAEFCGNAARCAALFIFGKNAAKKKIEIKTKVGRVCCEIIDSKTVQVEMPKVEWL